MKIKNSIKVLLLLISIQSLAGEIVPQTVLSDQEAIELGMTEVIVDHSKKLEKEPKFKFQDSFLDIAKIVVVINKSIRTIENNNGQTLKIYQDGVFIHEFDTSTGTEKTKTTTSGRKYIAKTPIGIFRAKRAYKEYQSNAFFGARMDYAVFFNGGIATHSTSKAAYKKLGKRASGGCARLRFEDAQTLSEILRSTGEGHSNLWDVGFKGLERFQYSDRIKLPNLDRYSGEYQEATSALWTYDAAIIVTN